MGTQVAGDSLEAEGLLHSEVAVAHSWDHRIVEGGIGTSRVR